MCCTVEVVIEVSLIILKDTGFMNETCSNSSMMTLVVGILVRISYGWCLVQMVLVEKNCILVINSNPANSAWFARGATGYKFCTNI